jgi:hypothetical protein
MPAQPDEQQLAKDLIALVEERVAPKAALLQKRIDGALAYMEKVQSPNLHTLNHIRRHLTTDNDTKEG